MFASPRHHLQEGNAIDQNGSKRLVSNSGRTRGNYGHHKTRAWHVRSALPNWRALVLGNCDVGYLDVASSVATPTKRGEWSSGEA